MWSATRVGIIVLLALTPSISASGHPVHGAPKIQTAYYGIVLGRDGKSEVNYKLGDPPQVTGEFVGEYAPVYNVFWHPNENGGMPKGRDFRSFNEWYYGHIGRYGVVSTDHELAVDFGTTNDKVTRVSCFQIISVPAPVVANPCMPVQGVRIGDSEAAVIQRLGSPDSAEIDGSAKIMRYTSRRAEILLTKQRVNGMRVLSGQG
jgi:hypothetical protein